MQRRRFLQTVTVGGALLLAGCSGGGDPGGQETTTTTPGDSDGDGGTGGDTTTAAPPPTTDTPTPSPTPDEQPTDAGTSAPPAGEPTGTPGSPGNPTLGGTNVQFVDNYRFSVDLSDYEGGATDMTMEGAWHGSDFVTHATVEGQDISVYQVGGTMYLDASGYCTPVQGTGSTPMPDIDAEEWAGTDEAQSQVDAWPDLTATGQTTIDGESVWIFAVDAGDRDNQHAYRYYIGQTSGYLRRAESQGVVIDYWDWGAVDSIQAPC